MEQLRSPLEHDDPQRTRNVAKLAFHLACNELLDDALAGNRSVEDAGATITGLRPLIMGVEE